MEPSDLRQILRKKVIHLGELSTEQKKHTFYALLFGFLAGIMQRFIAGKGRLSFPQMNSDNEFVTDKPIRRPLGRSLTGLDVNTAVRKGYIPAGEKIQEELKEMEKREEELR